MADTHEMVRSGRDVSGAEEWACPRCGRRLLLRWPPRIEKLVLEQGDVTAVHVGGQGGVRASGITADEAPATADRQWLRDIGIGWDDTPP
jgi:DNA-directed RNA polymerase subunit RPC12/RpoP